MWMLFVIVLFVLFGGFLSLYELDFIDFVLCCNIKELGVLLFENGYYFGFEKEGCDLFICVV